MLISQCIFTNLQVGGGCVGGCGGVGGRCWAEKTYNLFVNGLEEEEKTLLVS